MTNASQPEVNGSLALHSFAELVAEISRLRLGGSLRLSKNDKKCIVYFRKGVAVFAVSNARSSRLFEQLLRRAQVTKADIAKAPDPANDFELAAYLQRTGVITGNYLNTVVLEQIQEVLVDVMSWPDGQWSFTHLARIRDGLAYPLPVTRLLTDYVRSLPHDYLLSRFQSLDEPFLRSEQTPVSDELLPDDLRVLDAIGDEGMEAVRVARSSGLPEASALRSIYLLWLRSFIDRPYYKAAFSSGAAELMQTAKLKISREAKTPEYVAPTPEPTSVESEPHGTPRTSAPPEIDIDTYLSRVEAAVTHYDVLGVTPKAAAEEIKAAYFSLARSFHPDRYHSAGGDLRDRVQNAFTMLAQAHESLKTPESRELYDYRMRKELADREEREAQGNTGNASLHAEQAHENFEHGYQMLLDDEYTDALPFLARAVHYAPKHARYHAFYGKALSFDAKQKHKAESEMQAAVRLDPANPKYRLMLAEFFIKEKLLKRAEGELNRLLAAAPDHREAQRLIDDVKRLRSQA